MNIRPMKPDDYDAICHLWKAAGLSYRPAGRDTRRAITAQLRHFPTTYLVAEVDGRIIGTVMGTHDHRKGWINRLAVHPDHRRRAVAGQLLAACEAALADCGMEIVAALIEEGNDVSAHTFRHAGYVTDCNVWYFRKRARDDI